jgi:Fic family protein
MNKPTQATRRAYIWQHPDWPNLSFTAQSLAPALDAARQQQARLLGQIDALGFSPPSGQFNVKAKIEADNVSLTPTQELLSDLWVQDALATAAIEGEKLDINAVRSSVHRKLGLSEPTARDRTVEGLVDILQDASGNYLDPLSKERLCGWQAALFPSGRSGLHKITVGQYRTHSDTMEIVSGLPGREITHYVAPPSKNVGKEMSKFLNWFERTKPKQGKPASTNGLIRAAIAHFWFETIHPFEDGNGRVGRAIVDLAIAQDLGNSTRVFNVAKQFLASRKAYYNALNLAQTGNCDITDWIQWFLHTFSLACINSQTIVQQVLLKTEFWQRTAQHQLNARQSKVLQRLVEAGDGGFLGGMTADKYCKITGASKATATRDLTSLLIAQLLVLQGTGRATRYAVAVRGWNAANTTDALRRRRPDLPAN